MEGLTQFVSKSFENKTNVKVGDNTSETYGLRMRQGTGQVQVPVPTLTLKQALTVT
ncbi:hypothetical protein DPMN_001414 [Dreissena polymorpha]|uniref:Uncharacterized protein n=1 Tax=Dreissena polymorpha TaxID=45954 RepID=A0A9D4MK03_DREPO|nr:hypothetical protein DPMN_001414 [Dreissena polymorpha]